MYGYMRSSISTEPAKPANKSSINQRRNQTVFKSRRRKKPGFFQRLRRNKPFVDNKEDEKQESIFDSNEITNLHKNAPRNSYIHMDPVDSYVDEICGSSNSNDVDNVAIRQNEDDQPSVLYLSPQSSFQSNSDTYITPSTSTGKSLESIDTSTFDNDSTWTVNVVHEFPKITLKEVLKDLALDNVGSRTPKVEKGKIWDDARGEQRVRIELQNNEERSVEKRVGNKEYFDDHNITHGKKVDEKESKSYGIKPTNHPKDDLDNNRSEELFPPSEALSKAALSTEETVESEEIYKPQIVLRPKKVKDQLIQQINSIYHRYSMKRKESMIEVENTIRHSLYDIQYTTACIEIANEKCDANKDVEKTFHEVIFDSTAFYLIERPVDRDIIVFGTVKDTVNHDVSFELTESDVISFFDKIESTANCELVQLETSIEYAFFGVTGATEYFDLDKHKTNEETVETVLTEKSSEYGSVSYSVTYLNFELEKDALDCEGEASVIPSITQLESCKFSVTTVENDFCKSSQAGETEKSDVTVRLTDKDTCSFSVTSMEKNIQRGNDKNYELLEVKLPEIVTETPISLSFKLSKDAAMDDQGLIRLIELSGQSSDILISRDNIARESKELLPNSQEDLMPPLVVDVDVDSEERGAYSEVSISEHMEISPPLILKNCRKCACACWRINVTQSNSYSEICRCFEMEKESEDNILVNSLHLEEKLEKVSGENFGEISKKIGTISTETLLFGITSTEIVLKKEQDENASREAVVFYPIKSSATESLTISENYFVLPVNFQSDEIAETTLKEEQLVKHGDQLCISQIDDTLVQIQKEDRSQNADIFIPEVTVEQVKYSENLCATRLDKLGKEMNEDGCCKVKMTYKIYDTECLSITSFDDVITSPEETEYVCHDIKLEHNDHAILSLTDLSEQFNKPEDLMAEEIALPITMSDIISYSEITTDVDFANSISRTMNSEVTWNETMFYQVSLAVTWIDFLLVKPQMSQCVKIKQNEDREESASFSIENLDSVLCGKDDECTVFSTWEDKNSEKFYVDLKVPVSYKDTDFVKKIQREETESCKTVVDTDSNFSRDSAVITRTRSMSPSIASTSNAMSEVPEDPFHDFLENDLVKYGEMLPMPICRSVSSINSEITVSEGEESLNGENFNNIVKDVLNGLVEKVIKSHLDQFEQRFSTHARSSPARLNLMTWFDNSDLVQEQIAEVKFRHAIKFAVPKPVMFSDDDDLPISDDEFENPSMDDSTATITSNTSKLVLNSSTEEQNGKNGEPTEEPEKNGTAQPENGSNRPSEPLGLGGSGVPPRVQPVQANGAGKAEDSDEQAVDEEAIVFKDGSIVVSIRAYEKKSEGFNAYIVYKIETRVSGIPNYTKSMNEVWRRFSDFLGLRDKLMEKYQHKGVAIPLAPEKSLAALTKTKLNTTNDEGYTTDVAEKRARLLERFLRRLCRSPRLVVDCDVVDFLTLDANLPKATFTAALSAKSMQKIFKSFGDALNKIAYPMDENDRWFEQMHGNVEELDDMLVRLHSIVDQLGSFRRELSQSSDSLSKSLSMIASCEENTALARTLSKLAEAEENLSVVQKHEADTDSQILAEAIQEHLHMTQVLKELFFERVKAWQNWQTLRQNLAKKRELKARFDLAGRSDRSNVAKAEVEDCEQRVDKMEQDFQEMSKTIRREYIRLCKERRTDLKQAFIAYLEALVESEQHILEHWQKFGPEVQSII